MGFYEARRTRRSPRGRKRSTSWAWLPHPQIESGYTNGPGKEHDKLHMVGNKFRKKIAVWQLDSGFVFVPATNQLFVLAKHMTGSHDLIPISPVPVLSWLSLCWHSDFRSWYRSTVAAELHLGCYVAVLIFNLEILYHFVLKYRLISVFLARWRTGTRLRDNWRIGKSHKR